MSAAEITCRPLRRRRDAASTAPVIPSQPSTPVRPSQPSQPEQPSQKNLISSPATTSMTPSTGKSKEGASAAPAPRPSPQRLLHRAQIVTFLWRASASTGAEDCQQSFTDVAANAYYTRLFCGLLKTASLPVPVPRPPRRSHARSGCDFPCGAPTAPQLKAASAAASFTRCCI